MLRLRVWLPSERLECGLVRLSAWLARRHPLTLHACLIVTCWTASPALAEETPTVDLRLPSLRLMEPGLPYPCEVGAEDCAPPEPGDRIVPRLRWDALRLQLLDCYAYPGLARAALDEQDGIWRIVMRGALHAQAARLAVDEVQAASDAAGRWSTWEVYLWVGLFSVAALAVGAVVGAAVVLVRL
jgi:hypothetical protein